MRTITMRRWDDFHVHFREHDMLKSVVPATARHFARALVMPNTEKPIRSEAQVEVYRTQILAAVPMGTTFQPLMTVKLVEATQPEQLLRAKKAGAVAGKLYPEGVTTNSADGVTDIRRLYPVFETMRDCEMVLCLHGELPGAFCLDRERAFLPTLGEIARDFPKLKIVLEHVSCADAVRFVLAAPDNVAATITVHHLLLTLDDVVGGMLQPHHFCKPIAKTREDRAALLGAAMSGSRKFFLGTDSAPHLRGRKECASGCAGVYTSFLAHAALTDIFERQGALDGGSLWLEYFTSAAGADHYGLPRNKSKVTLERLPTEVPTECEYGVVPFLAGRTIPWRVAG